MQLSTPNGNIGIRLLEQKHTLIAVMPVGELYKDNVFKAYIKSSKIRQKLDFEVDFHCCDFYEH